MKKLILISTALLVFCGLSSRISYSQSGFNTVIEFCTGTWCQWCPCADDRIHEILQNFPNTLILAYHGPVGYGDPFDGFNGNNIIPIFGFNAYPTGVVGRRSGIISRDAWNNPVVIQSNTIQPSVSVSTTKSFNTGTRLLSVTANITAQRNLDTSTNVNFIVIEDNVVYLQTGNGSCPGSGSYTHEWIVRNMVNGAMGEALSTGHWNQGTTMTKNWSVTIPANWVDQNLKIAVMVYMQGGSISTNALVQQTKRETMLLTGIENQNQNPASYSLSQNYPNPFNPVTNVKFSLPKDGPVSFKIYDVVGNEVGVFVDGFMKAGTYNAEFDGTNYSSGVYFYKLVAGDFTETKKMILSK
jgi:hypothetical protein